MAISSYTGVPHWDMFWEVLKRYLSRVQRTLGIVRHREGTSSFKIKTKSRNKMSPNFKNPEIVKIKRIKFQRKIECLFILIRLSYYANN